MKKIPLIIFLFILNNYVFSQPFSTATTAGKLPSLAYSNSVEDRLGAAKMGYIDSNITMRILDSTKDFYHVQLSKNHSAYLEKTMAHTGFQWLPEKPSTSDSWKVFGDSAYDYVHINLDKKLPYKTWMTINPSKIIVEIYGVMANTNWISQLSSVKEIKNVYYEQTEDDVVKVTIELLYAQPWGYHISYEGKQLQIKIKQRPADLKLNNLTIAIDAGHGGTNLGADGIRSKVLEKDYTLLFAETFQKLLAASNVKTIMTREKDTLIDNKDRVLQLQNTWPDLLISFHLNSAGKSDIQGISTYYKHIAFRPLTQALLNRLLQIDGLKEYGNVGNFNFQLIQPSEFNSSLIEVAFLSNPEDERKILNEKFRQQVAAQIVKGIEDWLKDMD